jgi:hypothetical protein
MNRTSGKELNIFLTTLALSFGVRFGLGPCLGSLDVRLEGKARHVEPNKVVCTPTELFQRCGIPLFQQPDRLERLQGSVERVEKLPISITSGDV